MTTYYCDCKHHHKLKRVRRWTTFPDDGSKMWLGWVKNVYIQRKICSRALNVRCL